MCVCVCVFVCVCVHLSPFRLLLTEQNKFNARVQVSNGMLWKYVSFKDLCLLIKDIHAENFQMATLKNVNKTGKSHDK